MGHPSFQTTAAQAMQQRRQQQMGGGHTLIQQAMQLQHGITQNDGTLFQSLIQQGQYPQTQLLVNQVNQQKPTQQQAMLPSRSPQQGVMQQVRSPQTANNSMVQVRSPNPNPSPRPQSQPAPSPRTQPSPCPGTAGGLQMNSPHHQMGGAEPMQTDQQPMLSQTPAAMGHATLGAMPNAGHAVNANPGLNQDNLDRIDQQERLTQLVETL